MIGKTPPVGPGSPHNPEEINKTTPTKPFSTNGDDQVYKKWGGMQFTKDEWKKFMSSLLQQASHQIQQDLKRSLAALKRIKNVAEGKDPDA
jgi:hypothetical protein